MPDYPSAVKQVKFAERPFYRGDNYPSGIKGNQFKATRLDQNTFMSIALELDQGEASAIALALENEGALLIIDEKKGRSVANRLKITTIGTVGILVEAKRRNLISSLRPLFVQFTEHSFWASKSLLNAVLVQENEVPLDTGQ